MPKGDSRLKRRALHEDSQVSLHIKFAAFIQLLLLEVIVIAVKLGGRVALKSRGYNTFLELEILNSSPLIIIIMQPKSMISAIHLYIIIM